MTAPEMALEFGAIVIQNLTRITRKCTKETKRRDKIEIRIGTERQLTGLFAHVFTIWHHTHHASKVLQHGAQILLPFREKAKETDTRTVGAPELLLEPIGLDPYLRPHYVEAIASRLEAIASNLGALLILD